MPTSVYRIVLENPPSERDLMTYEELDIPVTSSDPDAPRMRTGLSVFVTLSDARKKAKGLPWRGRCLIAEIVLPEGANYQLEQTGQHSRRHYTLWCDRQLVRASISRILPVKEGQTNV
jgi:hypothetical protein